MLVKRIIAATAVILSLGLAGVANASAATAPSPHQVGSSAQGFGVTNLDAGQAAAYPCGDSFNRWTHVLTFRNCSYRSVDVLPGYLKASRHNAYFNAGIVTVPRNYAAQWRIYMTSSDEWYETLVANKYGFGPFAIQYYDQQQAYQLPCGMSDFGPMDLVFKNCAIDPQDIAPGYEQYGRHHVYTNGGVADVPQGWAVRWHFTVTPANSYPEIIGIDSSTFTG